MEGSPRSRLMLPLIHQLATLLLFIPTISLSAVIETNSAIVEYHHHHVAWRENNQTRFDFVFSLNGRLRSNVQIDSINQSALSTCVDYDACLLQDGKVIQKLKEQLVKPSDHQTIFFSDVETPSISPSQNQSKEIVVINHYCNIHWNPLVHNARSGSNHLFNWFSPMSCLRHNTNYERPCYVYNSLGNLIDITPWILSDGSSYQVEVGSFNKTIKEFNLNVCNDAHNACGPNVASCYIGNNEHIENGYNNLTSITYNETEKAATLTSLGQFNSSCPGGRLQTVVKFICKNKIIDHSKPKLVKVDACESLVEWKTVHACPEPDIRKRATDCTIKNDAWGINIDLKQVTNNATSVLVPKVMLNNEEHSMALGLCRGFSPSTVKCEGKSNFQTSACLLKPQVKSHEANVNNSKTVGLISESYIRFTDNRVFLESYAVNKSCQVLKGRFDVTKQLGTRIEFFCSPQNQSTPTFLDFADCTYIFEWGSPLLCFENHGVSATLAPRKNIEPVVNSSSSPQKSIQPEESESVKTKTAHEMHIESLDDAKKMLEPQHDQKSADDRMEKPSKAPSPSPPSNSGSTRSNSASTSVSSTPTSKSTPIHQVNNVTPSSHKTVDIGKVEQHTTMIEPQKLVPRMNAFHKFFMSGLILMVLTAFIVVIFILDKKTRLRIPLGSIRRQARQVFQFNQQPYSRVHSFNDVLDL